MAEDATSTCSTDSRLTEERHPTLTARPDPGERFARANAGKSIGRHGRSARTAADKAIDVQIGERIRWRRSLLGMSRQEVGQALGISFQQVQKYERGTNCVRASRLLEFAEVLTVPITFFFAKTSTAPADGPAAPTPPEPSHSVQSRSGSVLSSRSEAGDLVCAFYRIPNAAARRQIIALVHLLGS